jgi:anti-sigma-K factor RskA
MWTNGKRGKDDLDDETLNRFSGELLRAFEAGEAEISTAAASPFLYRRIRVRIEAEERRLARQRGAWLSLLAGVKHAIPVMAAFAVVAVASLMLTSSLSQQSPAAGVVNDEPTLMSDVFSFSQDELIASAAGVEAGQPRNGGGTK